MAEEVRKVDAKGRVALGSQYAGQLFLVTEEGDQIVLVRAVAVPYAAVKGTK